MSGTPNEIIVSPANEAEITAVIVFLKARSKHFGEEGIPIEVLLSPLAPEEGWRRAAIKFMEARWAEKQRGERPNWRSPPERQSLGLMTTVPQFNESH